MIDLDSKTIVLNEMQIGWQTLSATIRVHMFGTLSKLD